MLIWPDTLPPPENDIFSSSGPKGPLAEFLRDFGPALLEKYQPRAVVVFSAHWETSVERQGESISLITQHGFEPNEFV